MPPTNAISDNVLQVDYGDVVDLEDLDFDEMEVDRFSISNIKRAADLL